MFTNIKKLREILLLSGVKKFNLLFLYIFINSFFELLSIGVLIPFITLILDSTAYDKFIEVVRDFNFFRIHFDF